MEVEDNDASTDGGDVSLSDDGDQSMEIEDNDASTDGGDVLLSDDADQSIQVDRTFIEPYIVHERSIVDEQPPEAPIDDRPTEYEIIPNGSQLGHDLLVDSDGYSYVIKQRRPQSTTWRCSVRSIKLTCPATVAEKGNKWQSNSRDHIHPPKPERGVRAKVTVKAKSTAAQDTWRSASSIVTAASESVEGIVCVGDMRSDYVARVVNRFRRDMRPDEPIDMDFELDYAAMPEDFFRREVKVDDERHLIFATDGQLDILSHARRWYLDGTYKVMRDPFEMLLSIHAFVRRGDCSKQVPLLYVVMTRKKAIDYAKVLKVGTDV